MVSPVSGGDTPINYNNPVDPTEGTDQVAQTAEEEAAAQAAAAAETSDDDVAATQSQINNATVRDIFDRIQPDDISALIKVDPSGKGGGGTNPFELFNSMGSGGSSGSTGL